jgi:CheY-like chemotaxis protein
MSLASWNVLVVEDEADSMELVQGILNYSGIHSVGATSGEEALRAERHAKASNADHP